MRILSIYNNPLRILGVFANASQREIEKNKAQLRAFAHVRQEVLLPLWLNGLELLPPLTDVTEEKLAEAQAQLSLQKERDRHTLFWFEQDKNHVQDEYKAIELLNSNRVDEARQLWEKRTDRAAQKNLLLIAVLTDDWDEIATEASLYFEANISAFRVFMAEVVKTSPKANSPQSHELLDHFEDESWGVEMKRMLVNWHKQVLDDAIDHLNRTDTNDSELLKKEIERTYSERCRLVALQNLLGSESFICSFYANELSKTLLNAIKEYLDHNYSVPSNSRVMDMVKELCKDLSENEPDFKKLSSLESIIEYRIRKNSSENSSSDSDFKDGCFWYFIIWLVCMLLARACGLSGEDKKLHYPFKPYEYGVIHTPPKTFPKYPNINPNLNTYPYITLPRSFESPEYYEINGHRIHKDSLRDYIDRMTHKKRINYMDDVPNTPEGPPILLDKDTLDSPMDSVFEYQDLPMPMEQMEP